MKQTFLLLISYVFTLNVFSQDKDIAARTYYTKAEEFYNSGSMSDFDRCVIELEKAEKMLQSTNPKILYLKIKAMSELCQKGDWFYGSDLDTSIKTFYKITDSKTYPADKYAEIINIDGKFTRTSEDVTLNRNFKNTDSAYYYRARAFVSRGKDTLYARIFFLRAAEMGNTEAMLKLGQLHFENIKNNKGYLSSNLQEAENWFNKAIEANAAAVCKDIGTNYYFIYSYIDDQPMKTDLTQKALKYLSQAYQNGDWDATYYLGNIYAQRKEKADSNYKKAIEYYLISASCIDELSRRKTCLSSWRAMRELSKMYEYGLGVKKDKTLAEEWEKKSVALRDQRL